jgi:hypothetical protein
MRQLTASEATPPPHDAAMFQLNVYCRRTLNTIPPRSTSNPFSEQSPAVRFTHRIQQGSLRGQREVLSISRLGMGCQA